MAKDKQRPPALSKPLNDADYQKRKTLIEKAYQSAESGEKAKALKLSALIAAMRTASQDDPSLSSMYFAGGFVDHPFFLESESLAAGVAVLPEDAAKAGQWKRHPHQQEFIVVLEGQLLLQEKDPANSEIITYPLAASNSHLIDKNICHRVLPDENHTAAYIFVKSNPMQKPLGESC